MDVKRTMFIVVKCWYGEDSHSISNHSDTSNTTYPLWGAEWRSRMGMKDLNKPVLFRSQVKYKSSGPILTPSGFDPEARRLLDFIKTHQQPDLENCRLVFFAEDLGGIILKRALIIADSEDDYEFISRNVCACVLCGVPRLSTPFPTGYLARTTFDFTRIAFRMAIVSICQYIASSTNEDLPISVIPDGTLDLPHEYVIERGPGVFPGGTSRFALSAHHQVESIFGKINEVAAVSAQGRKYMKMLSHPRPFTRYDELECVQPAVDAVVSYMRLHRASAIFVRVSRRVDIDVFSYGLYKKLVRDRGLKECVAYFAFDRQDYRRRSVPSMLATIIQQLLATYPKLIDSFLECVSNEELRWAEGSLWFQLRSIIRKIEGPFIHLVVGSVTDNSSGDSEGFMRRLLDLASVNPGRLKVWCTLDLKRDVPVTEQEGVECTEWSDMAMVESNNRWHGFQENLSIKLGTENPKFAMTQDSIKETLQASESFLHSIVLAHRIRGTIPGSSLGLVRTDIMQYAQSWYITVKSMMEGAPSWVAHAVSSMLFARRPLKPSELAVTVALLYTQISGQNPLGPLDDDSIRVGIDDDLRRWLGPLIRLEENGELRFVHTVVNEVLGLWLNTLDESVARRHEILTRLTIEYIHVCLGEIGEAKIIDKHKLRFSFLEYALAHWHVHYQDQSDNASVLPSRDGTTLKQRVLDLLNNPRNLAWLQPQEFLSPSAPGDFPVKYDQPVYLAARLGLFDSFTQLFNPTSTTERLKSLEIACQNGHLEIVRHLLQNMVDLEAMNNLLSTACDRGDEEMGTLLIGRLQEVDQEWKEIPPHLLIYYCMMGHKTLAERLIIAGANVNSQFGQQGPPLHVAVEEGHLDIVDLLLKNGADVNYRSDGGWTALQRSIYREYNHISRRLLKEDNLEDDVNEDGLTSIDLAARVGDDDLLKQVIDLRRAIPAGLEANGLLAGPLHEAVAHDHQNIVETLHERGASLNSFNSEGKTALFVALSKNHRKLVDYLLDRDAIAGPQEFYKNSALEQAILHGNIEATKRLLERLHRGDLSNQLCFPLAYAAQKGHVSIAKNLINAGANLFGRVANGEVEEILGEHATKGWALIHFFAYYGSAPDVFLLLVFDPHSVNSFTYSGHTLLHLAAFKGSASTVAVLLQVEQLFYRLLSAWKERTSSESVSSTDGTPREDLQKEKPFSKAEVNVKTQFYDTPLHLAVRQGHANIVKLLLENGADANAINKSRVAPLHEAAGQGNETILEELINHGAELDILDCHRFTPLRWALMNSRLDAAIILLKAGADTNIRDGIDGNTALTAMMANENQGILDIILLRPKGEKSLCYKIDVDMPNDNGQSPLELAMNWKCHIPSTTMLETLLNAGTHTRTRKADGRTITHMAATAWWNFENEEAFFSHKKIKAHLDTKDRLQLAPIHLAAKLEKAHRITSLIKCGASIATTDAQGRTAMHHAVRSLSSEEFAQVFSDFLTPGHDNNVNIPDKDGWTPFHWACRGSLPGVAELLFGRYRNPIQLLKYECKYGWRALDIAILHEQERLLNFIREGVVFLETELNNENGHEAFLSDEPVTPDAALEGRGMDSRRAKLDGLALLAWKAAVDRGFRSDGKRLVYSGSEDSTVPCDDCQYKGIRGIRYKCEVYREFYLCFKCYWHRGSTYYSQVKFREIGEGPKQGPEFVEANSKEEGV